MTIVPSNLNPTYKKQQQQKKTRLKWEYMIFKAKCNIERTF